NRRDSQFCPPDLPFPSLRGEGAGGEGAHRPPLMYPYCNLNCWQALLSHCHSWIFVVSAVPQPFTSSTRPLLRFTSLNQGEVVVIFCPCWKLFLSKSPSRTFVQLFVPQFWASNTRPLFSL